MKKVVFLLVLALVLVCPLYGQKAPKEYNLGSCGEHFNVEHAVISDHQILFTHHLLDAATVEKKDKPDTFNIYKELPDKDGVIKFAGKLVDESDAKLDVSGFIKGNRMVMVLTVNGDLGHAFYGEEGSVDDMVKVVSDHYDFCVYLHTQKIEDIPDALVRWLNSAKDSQ